MDFIEELRLLTARRVRHITSASSSRPASAEHGHGATLPENSTIITLSGHNDTCINGSAVQDILSLFPSRGLMQGDVPCENTCSRFRRC